VSIIETKQLSKHFKDTIAVDAISFTVKKGEIFGFLGPNGAGKTTTIKMLTTLLHPTKGAAHIAGFDIIKQRNQVRKNIGVVFQEPALDTELTGQENLDFHARIYGMNTTQRQERINEVLDLVDLTEKKDVLVKNYSGGMKRRLEIARGLMHCPTVLFLDEPTLGLDAQTRRAIWDYIKTMNKQETTTIFLTTHYMEEAEHLCDRVGIIDKGKILVMDTLENLKTNVGQDVITLSCSDMKQFHDYLKKQTWVDNLKQRDTELTFGVKKGEEKIPKVIEHAQKLGIKVTSISVRKPTLDDVFLHFTGRSIRNEAAENTMKQMMHFRGR